MIRASLAAALLFAAACSPVSPASPIAASPPITAPAPSAEPAPLLVASPDPDPAAAESRRRVDAMLRRVSRARGLPVTHEVESHVLDRAGILARIRSHVEKEIPPSAVEHEGELLTALELTPPDYDFVEGSYKLIQGRIAGFYEPSDRTMYLVDDLSDDEAAETLAHELDHALQDQSFSLAPMIEYAPGDGDRVAAAHAVIEGDAMSAMLDVVAHSAFDVSDGALRTMLAVSNALSDVSAATPHVLQASLSAPYSDGFAFVQRERTTGGWPAVDAALRRPPLSTEQLLHADKYASREPPLAVAVPTFAALGPGFVAALDDVNGEQGLRLMLEEWASGAVAERAAAGWGGDRYLVARRDGASGNGAHTIAVVFHTVMDTPRDAEELAQVLDKRFGKACRERPLLGPLAWKRRGRDVVVAAGPYERQGTVTRAAGKCPVATAWIEEILRAPLRPRGARKGTVSPPAPADGAGPACDGRCPSP